MPRDPRGREAFRRQIEARRRRIGLLYNYWAVMAFLFGAIVGSFLNVVVWRLPRGQSLVHPGSHCPNCDRPLQAFETMPLVSLLALSARCRGWRTRISPRYFRVGFITAGLF